MSQRRIVLITGGTGSFGSAMVDFLLDTDIEEIRILSRDEAKQETMRVDRAEPRLRFYIGDVRDRSSVDAAMSGVDAVFHAAALKQVPSCEFFPIEAVKTNVLGSENVIKSAVKHSVGSIVCLSTDKAVHPVNSMGMTKALMEKVAQASARGDTGRSVISCVRYGNVMYSRGSVIPLFVKQILRGAPLTVTEPEMTRFMLPLPDAVSLVDFAFSHADAGDIFIRKAPACTLEDLVTAMGQLFDIEPNMQVIGRRHGEKLYETLASSEELRASEDFGEYLRLRMDSRGLDYAKYFTDGNAPEQFGEDYHSHNAERLDVEGVKALLLRLPEITRILGERA